MESLNELAQENVFKFLVAIFYNFPPWLTDKNSSLKLGWESVSEAFPKQTNQPGVPPVRVRLYQASVRQNKVLRGCIAQPDFSLFA